jgi:hypothetical protein
MLRDRFFLSFICLTLALAAKDSEAYVRTMSETGRALYWSNPNVPFTANPRNSSGITEAQVDTELRSAIASWNAAGANASGGYSQNVGYPAASGNDGVNAVYFASNSSRNLDWGVVAVTEVLYYTNSGQIVETDIVFNDRQYLFTNTVGDTGKNIGGRIAIYLRDVAAHEIGHAFGIDHTTVNNSSLVYTAFSGQFNLSNDDKTALRTAYPAGGAYGSLRGMVRGRNGGIFGTHLVAINLATGKPQAGALANSDGSFRIGDLPPGKYSVMMEPFGVDISSISSYYKNVDHRFCGYSRFRRGFYSSCGSSQVTVVDVNSGGSTDLGVLSPSCTQMGNPGGAPSSLATAREVAANGGAQFGTLNTNESHYYRVRGISGALGVKAAAYSLYSPMDLRVEILSNAGAAVPGATAIDNVESPMPGGMINYDASASASNLSGDYVIRVSAAASRISSSNYPAGFELLDSSGHYLLMIGVNDSYGNSTITDMSSCISVSNTVQNASYRAPASTVKDREENSGCGSLQQGGGPFSGGISQALLAVLFLQLLATLMLRKTPRLVRRRR